MTRSEFFQWLAFARVYPMVEVAADAAGNAPPLGTDTPAEVPGIDPEIMRAFAASS